MSRFGTWMLVVMYAIFWSGVASASDSEEERLFRKLDTNHDGRVTGEEYGARIDAPPGDLELEMEKKKEWVKERFAHLDTNIDGILTFDELKASLAAEIAQKNGAAVNAEEAKAAARKAEADAAEKKAQAENAAEKKAQGETDAARKAADAALTRTWTVSGKPIVGKFLGIQSGIVEIETSERRIRFGLTRLSNEDKVWVNNEMKSREGKAN